MKQNFVKPVGILVAIVAVAIGAWALSGATSDNSSDAASAQKPGAGQMQGGTPPPGAAGYGGNGGPPNGGQGGPGGPGGPGNMIEVTGDAAAKAKAAALKEVSGTAERVMKNEDEDKYIVIVIKSDDSPAMVLVSGDFKSAEVQEMPAGPNGPPAGAGG